MVHLLAKWSDTKSNVKLRGFWSQLQASYVSGHTEELWYNETVCQWMTIYMYFYWITMPRKFGKHLYTEHWTAVSTLLGLISSAYCDLHHGRSNQPQNAETKTLPLGHRSVSHISDAKLTSHRENAWPLNLMCLEGMCSQQRTRSPPVLRLPKLVLWIHIMLNSWAGNKIIFL